MGRPSIAPEKLLRALLLQILHTIRSERGDITQRFFEQVLAQAREKEFLSDEHFTVDGTLIEAWAGQKSFKRRDREDRSGDSGSNPTVDFRGEKRSNATHQSTTDPEARLYKKAKGHEAKLSYLGHVLMENRNGLVVNTHLTQATGTALDGRTTRHSGYEVGQKKRKVVEEIFGWLKTIGLMRKSRHLGVWRVGWMFTFTAAAYNLVRMRNLVGYLKERVDPVSLAP